MTITIPTKKTKVKPWVPACGWTDTSVGEIGALNLFPEGDPSTVQMAGKDTADCGYKFNSTTITWHLEKSQLEYPELMGELEAAEKAINVHLKMMKSRAVEIGRILRGLKGMMPHGLFGRWLYMHFGFSHRTAQNFMIAADLCDKYEKFSNLPTALLYLIGAPSTPEWVAKTLYHQIEDEKPIPSLTEMKSVMAEAKAIEAKTPDMPAEEKAATVAKLMTAGAEKAEAKASAMVVTTPQAVQDFNLIEYLKTIGIDAALDAITAAFPDADTFLYATEQKETA